MKKTKLLIELLHLAFGLVITLVIEELDIRLIVVVFGALGTKG